MFEVLGKVSDRVCADAVEGYYYFTIVVAVLIIIVC